MSSSNLDILSGSASIFNGEAIIVINSLECEVNYAITAGGTLDGELVGPRLLHEDNISGLPCPAGKYVACINTHNNKASTSSAYSSYSNPYTPFVAHLYFTMIDFRPYCYT